MAKRGSRLAETNFSEFNLRDAYITDISEYYSALRDEALFSNYGLRVLIRIPLTDDGELEDNFIDEYSNFVNIQWEDTTESVVPLFKEYRQVLSAEGMTADGTDGIYPLEVVIPSKLHLPRNSRIIFSEYNCREERIAREWTVLGTQMKQLSNSKTYSRVANCVPSRQTTFDSIDVKLWANIYFSYNLSDFTKQIKSAFGNIWFSNRSIGKDFIKKYYITDQIFEEVDDETTYLESLSPKYNYISLPKYIQYSTNNFVQNELIQVYTVVGGQTVPVNIATDESGMTTVPLKIMVTGIDKNGKLTGYKFVPENGYTKFKTNTPVAKIQGFDASGNLKVYEQIPSTQTTIEQYNQLPPSSTIITNIGNDIVRYALTLDSISADSLNVIAIKDNLTFANIKAVSLQQTDSAIQETPVTYDTTNVPKYIKPDMMEAHFSAKSLAISVLD